MGLFDKALHEIEAGHPKSGAGLFAKARKTLEVQTPDSPKAAAALEAVSVHHEAFIPTPEELAAIDLAASLAPFSAEDLKSLSRELDSLPKGYDSLFAVFSRISEALPLSRLCLFSCESRLVRPLAALGWSLPKEALELTDASFLRTLTTGKALDSKKEPAHAELVAYLGEGQHRAFVRHGADGKPFALWIYSDPALDDSPELGPGLCRSPCRFSPSCGTPRICPSDQARGGRPAGQAGPRQGRPLHAPHERIYRTDRCPDPRP